MIIDNKRWHVGIHGYMGSGKSTVSKMITESLDKPSSVLPFAGPLKDFAIQLGWDGEKDARGRNFLQVLGTECVRAYDSSTWVRLWEEQAMSAPIFDVIIADDVRFDNEAEIIKSKGGVIIHIVGPNQRCSVTEMLRSPIERLITRIKSLFKRKHASERLIDKNLIDYTIINDGTVTELKIKVEIIINKIKDHYHE